MVAKVDRTRKRHFPTLTRVCSSSSFTWVEDEPKSSGSEATGFDRLRATLERCEERAKAQAAKLPPQTLRHRLLELEGLIEAADRLVEAVRAGRLDRDSEAFEPLIEALERWPEDDPPLRSPETRSPGPNRGPDSAFGDEI